MCCDMRHGICRMSNGAENKSQFKKQFTAKKPQLSEILHRIIVTYL